MSITALPPAPDPADDRATFNSKAFAFNAALEDFVDEANDLAADVNADAAAAAASASAAAGSATSASSSASAAATSAAQAATSAGAALWVSGSYNAGAAARSPSTLRVYIARTTGSKPTDPALDPTNWKLASSGGLLDVPYTGTTASPLLGERARLTNAAAVAVTVPLPTGTEDEIDLLFENGRYDNTYDLGAATLRHNGVAKSGVITNNTRSPIRLRSAGANEWRFA